MAICLFLLIDTESIFAIFRVFDTFVNVLTAVAIGSESEAFGTAALEGAFRVGKGQLITQLSTMM